MSIKKKTRLTLYGKVAMVRTWCKDCLTMTLVVDNKLQCCDTDSRAIPEQWRRESEPTANRRQPRESLKKQILKDQEHRCLYCEQAFSKTVKVSGKAKKSRVTKLRITWDHFIPYSYSKSRDDDNWVAACQFCNSWKSNLLFSTVEEARIYLNNQWKTKEIT